MCEEITTDFDYVCKKYYPQILGNTIYEVCV